MTAIPRYRPTTAPAVLSAGFRPFFLLAGFLGAGLIGAWTAMFAGWIAPPPTAWPPSLWHAHEMIFGYGAAALAGFLLTAVPNWTGQMPLTGAPLFVLVLLLGLGRIAMAAEAPAGPLFTALLDLAFPFTFIFVIAREIVSGRNWRNLPVLAALAVFTLANALTHAAFLGLPIDPALGARLGIAVLVMLITLIGGRIVPSFTRNWLVRHRPDASPPRLFPALERLTFALSALALLLFVVAPEGAGGRALGVIALLAALCQAGRLFFWSGHATWPEKLLFGLHLAYAWVAAGFALLAAASFAPARIPLTTALHGLTIGAIGGMTLAVMTRASLGHTGRDLHATPAITAIYAAASLAALLRLAPLLWPERSGVLIAASGLVWSGGFLLFLAVFAPVLLLPRRRG
jgi:uncharacterized protein involved in response to NO